jgi:hypothetical protein
MSRQNRQPQNSISRQRFTVRSGLRDGFERDGFEKKIREKRKRKKRKRKKEKKGKGREQVCRSPPGEARSLRSSPGLHEANTTAMNGGNENEESPRGGKAMPGHGGGRGEKTGRAGRLRAKPKPWLTMAGNLGEIETADESRGTHTFALALSRTCPLSISTEYSTEAQPYCLRIWSVFFCTKEAKLSMLPDTDSPAFFLASVRAL